MQYQLKGVLQRFEQVKPPESGTISYYKGRRYQFVSSEDFKELVTGAVVRFPSKINYSLTSSTNNYVLCSQVDKYDFFLVKNCKTQTLSYKVFYYTSAWVKID